MSVWGRLSASRRRFPVWLFLLPLFALSAWILACAPSSRAAAASADDVWTGTALGTLNIDDESSSSGSNTSSVSSYGVVFSFSFKASPGGAVIAGSGSGYYTSANWDLSGVNDGSSFGCDPTVSAAPFDVAVGGGETNDQVVFTLAIPDATETNDDTPCGGGFTAYASTTHAMDSSLKLVEGDGFHVSTTDPTELTFHKDVTYGSSPDSRVHDNFWVISVSPPSGGSGGGSGSGSGGGSGSGSGGGAGGGSGSGGAGSSCSLSLDHVAAKPAPARAGSPIVVSFQVSAAAHATLLVSPAGGARRSVVALNVPRGHNALIWGGWLGKSPAAAGQYALTVKAKACGQTRSQAVTVTTVK